jgi:putative transposase
MEPGGNFSAQVVMPRERLPVADVCRALEVSAASYHRWQQLYGGMKATEAKRLKELEQENTRFKRLLAEAELDKAMHKELAE